ncbi:hypothetical protein PG988_001268 [Apiospora saccharicola]
MFSKTLNLALLWAFLCGVLMALTVVCCPEPQSRLFADEAYQDAAVLPSPPRSNSDLVKRPTGQGESRGITVKLAIEEGGPIMEFYGTVQQVEKQIQAIKPDFKITPVHKPYTPAPKHLDDGKNLTCLDPYNNYSYPLYVSWNIDYLRGLGNATCGDHGGSDGTDCGQIACQWKGAIKWCNMGAEYYETKCSDFADYAADILHGCKHRWTTAADYIHGQEEDKTYDHDFTVVVEAGDC